MNRARLWFALGAVNAFLLGANLMALRDDGGPVGLVRGAGLVLGVLAIAAAAYWVGRRRG